MRPHDVTALAHQWIAPALGGAVTALDATAGAGADTLFLARAVGPGGRVHAFDIQPAALERARMRLGTAALAARVRWHRQCHSRAGYLLPRGSIAAAMFNLGWLPGGDPTLVTLPRTTLAALAACAELLRPGGRLSVVSYRGHRGGVAEDAAVARWLERGADGLEPLHAAPAASGPRAPVLRVLQRRAAPGETAVPG